MTEAPLTVRASEIVPGDFVDVIESAILRGPRGGKYRFRGVRVESRVVRCGWVDEFEEARGFSVTPSNGPAFVLPGNSARLVNATVRRNVAASSAQWAEDDHLLRDLSSSVRAVRLAAEAELERRTA
jgi:hypothetical protein